MFPLEEKEKNKKRRFRLFNLEKDGRGISKNDTESVSGLKRFFRCYGTNFGKLISVNIFMVLGNFPLFFAIAAFSGYTQVERMLPMSDLFQNLFGLMSARPTVTPAMMNMFAVEGMQYQTLTPTTATYIFYGIGLLFLFTFGLVNVGTAYILRNMVMGEPVFVWADFWYAVKRNVKQALPFGIVDAAVCTLLVYNIYSMFSKLAGATDILPGLMFWGNLLFFVLYFCMRFYIYVQMVTFDLKITKIIKNALIFALLGVKRNSLALLGILLAVLLELVFIFGLGGFLVPFAVAAPLTILFSTFAFMKVYASYFKIKELMIDPYMAEHPAEPAPAVEAVMKDDVTERERLDAVKKKNGIPTDSDR